MTKSEGYDINEITTRTRWFLWGRLKASSRTKPAGGRLTWQSRTTKHSLHYDDVST